jgi:AcrR family transcriptional regulator
LAPPPQTPKKGPAAPPGDAATGLKSRLTAAARKMLESEGLAGLSLRAAARASGVSHMAPYRHFASKDDLLAAIAEQGFLDLARALDEAATAEGETPTTATGVAYVLFALANPSLYRLMFGAQLQPCDRFPGLIAAGEAAFARCVAVARAAGYACPDEAELGAPPPVAAGMWSLVHGLASLAIDALIPLPDDDDARRAFVARVLTSSLAPPRVGNSGSVP